MFTLKLLRRKKNISQTELANAIEVSLRTIQLYEKKNANIPMKNLTKIADFFQVSISELYAAEVNEEDVNYTKNSKEQSHSITKLEAGKYLLTAPLIISFKQDEYVKKYNNTHFLKHTPKIGFVVDKVSVANYVSFEITNNSMYDGSASSLPIKTIVLGKQITLKNFIKIYGDSDENIFWVMVLESGIMCKQIIDYNKKEKTITCHSLNTSPEYPDFSIQLDDIKQLFCVIKKQID